MKNPLIWPLLILFLVLSGCVHHRSPEQHAQAFFEDGRGYILKSLRRQDASPQQLKQAENILDRDKDEVTSHIAALLRAQRQVFFAVTTGKDTATLLALENSAHQAQTQAVTSIGQMHEALQAAVGPQTWGATTQALEKKMARHMKR